MSGAKAGFANIALLTMVRHPLEQNRFELKRFVLWHFDGA
jgi:hypothetical protein